MSPYPVAKNGQSRVSLIAWTFGKDWILKRLNLSLQKEHTKFLDELQWDRKVQGQAEKVAEYLALAWRLEENSPKEDYRKANQLLWELAMWLPEDIYRKVIFAIAKPDTEINVLSAVVSARHLLLRDKAGNLTQDDIGAHAPGIGRQPAE